MSKLPIKMEVNPPKQEHLLALKGKLANLTPLNLFSPLLSSSRSLCYTDLASGM